MIGSKLPFSPGSLFAGNAGILRNYLAAISGSAGRLIFSLAYFVALANTLSIADFGLFATASAVGVVLSRIVGFGFITTLYRIATVRPALIGAYAGGFMMMTALSAPIVAVAAMAVYLAVFGGAMSALAFALVIVSECALWRIVETIIIVNNGMGKFARASLLVIIGVLLRAAAALVLFLGPWHDLASWAWLYLAANGLSLVIAILFFAPRARLRFTPRIYWRRLPDSLYVAGAEIVFYTQTELDKLLVLWLGNPHLAGVYAIIMRIVDLTAIPVRTFTMMLVQQIMRTPDLLASAVRRIGIEAAIMTVSTAGLGAMALLLHFYPRLLGANVAEVTPMLGLALLVPGLRNLIEYQAELLFARGQTGVRAIILASLGLLKMALLAGAIVWMTSEAQLIQQLNLLFVALYLVSAVMTYLAMRRPAKML
ncbi:MAG: lipopolysaccharide biosynthesis protein [Mesorhizobium sp.]